MFRAVSRSVSLWRALRWVSAAQRESRASRVPIFVTHHATYRILTAPPMHTISYEELKELLESHVLLIDVREKSEIEEDGQICGSVNIPLRDLENSLKMDPDTFLEKYKVKMPSTKDKIVFSCLGGVRSKAALDTALLAGYKHYISLEVGKNG
ncbi:thiosulfate sulfurtransferase/rhodanese-like domain-containing protein 3 isoform X2 [Callorhinchus milii]|uniref:thiosulfate sulfurtransferase/rhodanese-like domain-containing protein 3 isoform X2 n=1 Tax=Callorhinchus milii TaxID=7868 RepID=UPI00045763FC|nr:thiosulfate sulfurtransferase/rhodanese-like domain-containing protein 3 isoform X2 [Callorhinchus milii]|eukprot:gi/632951168/ref/XP_007891142.1/ PREDICTED: thiosulfate sulfurtransferase/rhodanese-like domain-containing protein 3 isoform X2 [Callorhinchus milii]